MHTWQIILQTQSIAIVSVSVDGQMEPVNELPTIFQVPWFNDIWD